MEGNLVFYSGYVRTPTADISTAKNIINIAISTLRTKYMCCDVKSLYLVTPLIKYEYIKIPIYILPEEVILEYNLMNLAHNRYVYC